MELQKNTERSKRKGAQPGSKNSSGGPPGNKESRKIRFLSSKYLPEETVSIIQEMPTDRWMSSGDQIQIAYAAIILGTADHVCA